MRQAGTDGDGSSTGPAKVPQLEEEERPSNGRCEDNQGRNGRDSSRLSVQNPTTSGSELDVGHPLEVHGTSSGASSMTSTESLSLPHQQKPQLTSILAQPQKPVCLPISSSVPDDPSNPYQDHAGNSQPRSNQTSLSIWMLGWHYLSANMTLSFKGSDPLVPRLSLLLPFDGGWERVRCTCPGVILRSLVRGTLWSNRPQVHWYMAPNPDIQVGRHATSDTHTLARART